MGIILIGTNNRMWGNMKKSFIDIIKRIWAAISYECLIFIALIIQFLSDRALDLDSWSSAWQAMDYSMGNGSRFLIGSIYRLFYGEYLDYTVAYKYVGIGIMLTIAVLSIVLGKLIRMAILNDSASKNAVYGTALLYLASPFSIAYVWNVQNLGRFDVYMILATLLAVLAAVQLKNVYIKILLLTLLSIIGLLIHQGFAFLYYPLVFTVMCYDVFAENEVHPKVFFPTVLSGVLTVTAAVYMQFFTDVNFESPQEMATFLQQKTNLPISEFALELEYFGSMEYQLTEVTSVFFQGNEAPIPHLLLIILLLLPVIVIYIFVWKDVFTYLKENKKKLVYTPHFYAMLSNLCFVPMFVIHVDWGRHIAPLMAGQIFVFLYFLARKDAAMRYAYQKMELRIRKKPWYFVLTCVWVATLDSFGARIFQNQADQLYNTLKYGFHI